MTAVADFEAQFAAIFAPAWEDYGMPRRDRASTEAAVASLNKWAPMARYEFRVVERGPRYAIQRRAR